ncbi:hypothetical protein WA026_005353 [Henosepilachna vigintioctopunctata]|uniref:Uncharacterized protein n=1 Tax=Henosepilachna vigintioctopunctata TaxID=420089 RepID=A0AAW1U1I3_9CUCU
MDCRSPVQHSNEVVKKKIDADAFVLIEAIEMITKHVKDMEKYIEKNTKVEIKELYQKMKKQVQSLNRSGTLSWIEKNKYEPIETPVYDVETQVNLPLDSKEIGTQTSPWFKNEDTLNTLAGVTSVEDFLNVERKIWEEKVFTNTVIIRGNPLNTEEETVKVVW